MSREEQAPSVVRLLLDAAEAVPVSDNPCRYCGGAVADDDPWCLKCHPPRRETAADVVKVLREIAGLDPTP